MTEAKDDAGNPLGTTSAASVAGHAMPVAPINAAIAATVGKVEPPPAHNPEVDRAVQALLDEAARGPTPEQNAAAMQAYIAEGVRHATGHFGSAEVVSVAAFREALGKLMEHLHLDHPENYLPK